MFKKNLLDRRFYLLFIILYIVFLNKFIYLYALDSKYIAENIEYCENLYFSNYKEFKHIWCNEKIVYERIFNVKMGIYKN